MKLIKGKVKFIRSIMGCFIFPFILCYFYTYVQKGSNWYQVNQYLGLALGILFIVRAIFEFKMAKNKSNAKFSLLGGGVILLYVLVRCFTA